MNYIDKINNLLTPKPTLPHKILDLFAGCGGLSLGFEAAGFHTVGYEMDTKAADTYNKAISILAAVGLPITDKTERSLERMAMALAQL